MLRVTCLIAWAICVIFTVIFLPPSMDDGIYLLPSVSTFFHWVPQFQIGNSTEPAFFILPTFPFLNGLFYKLIHVFGITIGAYSFRALIVFSFAGILMMACRIFGGAAGIFFVLLGITPFAQNWWTLRPELFGLFCLT